LRARVEAAPPRWETPASKLDHALGVVKEDECSALAMSS
jgi:hypothetical protein